MARDTIANAKAEVFALLGDASNNSTIANVVSAYPYDPGQSLTGGPLVLTLQTVGMDPDNFIFELRIYADMGADPAWVSAALDDAITATELLLKTEFANFTWVVDPHPDNEEWMVARRLVQVIREGPGLWE